MLKRMWTSALGAGALAGLCPGQTAVGVGSEVQLQAVLMTGDVLPIAGNVRSVQSIDVSEACSIAVSVEAFAPGSDNRRQVLLAGPHALPLIAIAVGGEPAPGNPSYTLPVRGMGPFHIGRFGEMTYQANLVGQGGASPTLVWVAGLGGPHLFEARVGEQVPGQPAGVRWSTLTPHVQAGSAFFAELAGISGPNITAENDRVLFTGAGATVFTVQSGTPIASLGGATLGLTIGTSTPTTNTGITAWRGTVTFSRGSARQAILATAPVQLVALAGEAAPGLPGVSYQEFRPFPSVGEWQGEIAFTASLVGNGVDVSNRSSIWTRSRVLVARGGQHASGTPEGVRYLDFSAPVLFGRENHVLFTASLQGAVGDLDRTALFAGPVGAISLVARAGAQAPGAPAGVVFGAFAPSQDADPIYVNSGGAIVFQTRLRGPGVTIANDMALYAWTPDDGLTLIAREGQVVQVRGQARTIGEITLNSPELGLPRQTSGLDGRRTILNRHGECFFMTTFADSTAQALMKAQVTHPPCVADFNADHFIDCFDYLDFIEAFEQGDPDADVNEDGFLDFFDYGTFVEWFEAGC